MKVYDIAGLGASTLDRFIKVRKFPTGREVQEVVESANDGGGPVSTALAVAGKFGANVVMLDRIGDDMTGRTILEDFKIYNVHTDGVEVVGGTISGCATILVEAESGKRAIFFERSTAPEYGESDLVRDLITDSKILHINGRHRQALLPAIKSAKKAHTLVSFDGGANRYESSLDEIMAHIDICIVARDFGENYTGETDLMKACYSIHEKGALIAGVTDGANGSYFVWPDGTEYRCAAYSQDTIVDTTGCGDSFHGAFLYGLTQWGTIDEQGILDLQHTPNEVLEACAKLASAVGALNTRQLGGRSGLPTLDAAKQLANI